LWRVPGRYKLVACWAIAACAAYGIEVLVLARTEPRVRRRVDVTVAAVVALSVVAVAGWGGPVTVSDRPAWWSIVAAGIAAVLVCTAARSARRPANVAVALIALVVLVDAPAFLFVMPGAPPAAEARRTHADDDEIVARLSGVRDRWRVYDEFVLGERAGDRLGIRDFRGYPALDPLSIHRYVDVLDFAHDHDPAIVTDYNVRWLLVHPHFRYGSDASFVRPTSPAFERRSEGIWEARHPAPLVVWYGAARLVDRASEALPAVRAAEDPDGIRRRAVLERADASALAPGVADALAAAPPDAREGTLEGYAPDEIHVAIDAPRPGLVVLDEIEFPGWTVEIDSEPGVELRANYLLRATWVGQGHHELVWRFAPPHWRLLVLGYFLALAIMTAAGVSALVLRARARASARARAA
jgi:hypothetical protein